jgi:hypothetical protein
MTRLIGYAGLTSRFLPQSEKGRLSATFCEGRCFSATRLRHLDPGAARAGQVGAVDPLPNDALGAKLAGVRKDGRAVLGDVFVE